MHKISWSVIKWQQKGRTLWYPTINIPLTNPDIKEGVYKVNILINDVKYSWIWAYKSWLFEANIFDFSWDLYWQTVEIIILHKIRNIIKFKDLSSLSDQIKKDIVKVKSIKYRVLSFWTFDLVHPWHEHYLKQASFLGDELFTIIARDQTVKSIKGFLPINDENNRMISIKNLWYSNQVLLWSHDDKLECIKSLKPQFIAIWYDQTSFTKDLNNLNLLWINAQIVVITPFKPEIYKSSIIKSSLLAQE